MPKHISADCKDILSQMICVDPSKRITAIKGIEHIWIKNVEPKTNQLSAQEQQELDNDIVNNLKKYRGESILKKAAMNVLVKHLSANDIDALK